MATTGGRVRCPVPGREPIVDVMSSRRRRGKNAPVTCREPTGAARFGPRPSPPPGQIECHSCFSVPFLERPLTCRAMYRAHPGRPTSGKQMNGTSIDVG